MSDKEINKEILEVIDENDNVIDLETRERIHKEGLLHREIHIWFLTPKGEIIFHTKDVFVNVN